VRKHDARHSRLLICVADSQKPMQSTSRLPPPPGVLGADSLGLDEPGDKARVLTVDPPVANCVGSCGESGAMFGSSCLGGRLSEGPVDGVSGVNGRGPLKLTPALVVLEPLDLPEVLLPLPLVCPDPEVPDPEVGSDLGAETDI
jgi:hypothetical protein